MDILAYSLIVIFVVTAAIIHFILLILKSDRNADFSYHVVAAPAFVVYGLGTFFLGSLSVLWFLVKQHFVYGFGFLAMAVLTGGSLVTQILLARKFDFTENITYLKALLPVTIAFFISGILFLTGIYMSYVNRWKYSKQTKNERAPLRLEHK